MSFPILTQDPSYHHFAGQTARFGIPNFANVVSNLAFLLVAVAGIAGARRQQAFREPSERAAYLVFLHGLALVAAGSAYYHWQPSDRSLFWDRLPMTVVFTSLLVGALGDRIHSNLARRGLAPALLLGLGSVVYWRWSGDLSLYFLVQAGSIAAIGVSAVLRPSHYRWADRTVLAMLSLYGLARLLEHYDRAIGAWVPIGGHPLKHLAAAAALGLYVDWVRRRKLRWDPRVIVRSNAPVPHNAGSI